MPKSPKQDRKKAKRKPRKPESGEPKAAGKLLALEGTLGRELVKEAEHLRDLCNRASMQAGCSRWDASNTFYELGIGKAKHFSVPVKTLLLLYAADLLFRLRWEIRPALAEGQTVIAAPYLETAIAFGTAAGIAKDWLDELFSFAPKPDACLRIKEKTRLKKKQRKRGLSASAGFVEFGAKSLVESARTPEPAELRARMLEYLDAMEAEGNLRKLGKKLPKL
jgi:hypothetical protein